MMNYDIARVDEAGSKITNRTTTVLAIAFLIAASLLFVPESKAQNSRGNNAFGFNSPDVSGFLTGRATLTGGGAYNPGHRLRQVGRRFPLH